MNIYNISKFKIFTYIKKFITEPHHNQNCHEKIHIVLKCNNYLFLESIQKATLIWKLMRVIIEKEKNMHLALQEYLAYVLIQ